MNEILSYFNLYLLSSSEFEIFQDFGHLSFLLYKISQFLMGYIFDVCMLEVFSSFSIFERVARSIFSMTVKMKVIIQMNKREVSHLLFVLTIEV